MFKGKKESMDPSIVSTIIGETVVVDGKISSKESIQIDGKVIGEVECQGNVIVGESGVVKANITARELVVSGMVEGIIRATERLIIKTKGKLIGETHAKSLIVDEGGTFLGKSKMESHFENQPLMNTQEQKKLMENETKSLENKHDDKNTDKKS